VDLASTVKQPTSLRRAYKEQVSEKSEISP
jgi:hypothetical protein